MKSKKPPRTKKKKRGYSIGDLNRLVDSVCHPLCETDRTFILLDGFLHALVEQDPPTTVKKFMRYSLPKIVKQFHEKRESR
jgi:hypothetical protein